MIPPYDSSGFRFTEIRILKNKAGAPENIQVSVGGQDLAKRPNIQIRFITEQGVVQTDKGHTATFHMPRSPFGEIACGYVRIEAFAYPHTCEKGSRTLDHATLAGLKVEQIAHLHDSRRNDPLLGGTLQNNVVDMIFSQPIRILRTGPRPEGTLPLRRTH